MQIFDVLPDLAFQRAQRKSGPSQHTRQIVQESDGRRVETRLNMLELQSPTKHDNPFASVLEPFSTLNN